MSSPTIMCTDSRLHSFIITTKKNILKLRPHPLHKTTRAHKKTRSIAQDLAGPQQHTLPTTASDTHLPQSHPQVLPQSGPSVQTSFPAIAQDQISQGAGQVSTMEFDFYADLSFTLRFG